MLGLIEDLSHAFSGKSEPLIRYFKNVRADLKVLRISLGERSICFALYKKVRRSQVKLAPCMVAKPDEFFR